LGEKAGLGGGGAASGFLGGGAVAGYAVAVEGGFGE
jgi:hypothetical protein